jgi:hypothetical protein
VTVTWVARIDCSERDLPASCTIITVRKDECERGNDVKSNTQTTTMSNSTSSDLDKKTPGEELFLVHLSRKGAAEPEPADFDRERGPGQPANRRSPSVSADEDAPTPGEELWKVHCRRFEGIEPDYDYDVAMGVADAKAPSSPRPSTGRASKTKSAIGAVSLDNGEGTSRVLHLRSRDVAIH